MTVSTPTTTIRYPKSTVIRAERAMRCAPFHLHLFITMKDQSVSLMAIAQAAGVEHRYTVKPLSELRAESELLWLIQVGLLRREVDGQGLTDSFRLTPLGRQLTDRWQAYPQTQYPANWRDRLYNTLVRWWRFSF